MSEELSLALISLPSVNDVKIVNMSKPIPAAHKKAVVHTPEVSGGFKRVFPAFYEANHQNVVDTKTKKRIVERETFTRYLHQEGGEKTSIFTTREIYFIPLQFKFARVYYAGAYVEGEKRAPDCQSTNGIVPQTAKLAKSCDECPMSKWEGSTPPPCGESPELLILDMTAKTIKDEATAAAVTAEAVTLNFKKSAIKPIKDLMKKLAEPVLFDDGTYSPIDMTQYLVKATLQVAINGGKEANYCLPVFEIVGQVPFEVSEQLLAAINTPTPSGKTPLELFKGRTEPFAELEKPEDAKAPGAAAPPAVTTPVVEVAAQPVEAPVLVEAPAPAPAAIPLPSQPAAPVAVSPPTPVAPPPAPAAIPAPAPTPVAATPVAPPPSDDDEVIF